jgi:pimeloyl-ACP methyl ester carboxylesterase
MRQPNVRNRSYGGVMDIILIGGLWLDDHAWDAVVPVLERRGHRAVPVSLPAAPDTTLDDQLDAVLAAVDGADQPLVVGHSAACSLAWLAADRRPEAVSRVMMIGGFPGEDGQEYAAFFPLEDGVMRFPGWEPFEGPDSDDLDEATKADVAARAVPVPEAVSRGLIRLTDDRRYAVPVTMVCPEYTPDEAREWLANGDLPELARVKDLSYVDLETGHWPMFSNPEALADALLGD